MIRKHESPEALKAGVLALLVHVLFFLVLVLGFQVNNEPPLQVSEVQLWDNLPTPEPKPVPPPEPPPPQPEPKVEPKPEPPPPPPQPKAEIVVKKKEPEPKPKPEKKKEEPPKPDPALKKKEEALKKQEAEKKRQQEILRKLQQMDDELADKALEEELKSMEAARNAQQAAVASSGVVDEYQARIRDKIRGLMNRQACGEAVVEYNISLLPTGQVAGTPRLTKSSGIPACDDAALRAIMQAQPLPLPPNPELFAKFRDLNIPFKPGQ